MDAANFDRWTRLLAASSRRSVLRGAAGAALAAALGGRLAPEAAARTCSLRGEECTTRACCTLGSPDLLHLVCRRGTCKCRKGYGDCDRDGTCETNLLTDDDNCGRCRVDCPSREACTGPARAATASATARRGARPARPGRRAGHRPALGESAAKHARPTPSARHARCAWPTDGAPASAARPEAPTRSSTRPPGPPAAGCGHVPTRLGARLETRPASPVSAWQRGPWRQRASALRPGSWPEKRISL